MRFGLSRTRALLAALGDPHVRDSVHIVGSNGKTSTAHFAAAALASQGRGVGLYTSPDVLGWNERIVVDGEPVSPAQFALAIGEVREAAGRLELAADDAVTQFEALTAAAFVAFAHSGCDVQVLEAGLGGRYDATNVLPPERTAVALTNVSLEHTDLLGETHEAIAAEKLAVCGPRAEVVVGPMEDVASEAVARVVARRGSAARWVGDEILAGESSDGVWVRTRSREYPRLCLSARGSVQRGNLAVALGVTEAVLDGPIADLDALRRAVRDTRAPGRLELVAGRPPVLMDGAHNPAAMSALAAAIPEILPQGPPLAVLSTLGDKDVEAMLSALAPVVGLVVTTTSSHPRAIGAERLAARCRRAGLRAISVEAPEQALDEALARAGSARAVVVCGSLYLLRDLYPSIVRRDPQGFESSPDMLARAAHRRAAH